MVLAKNKIQPCHPYRYNPSATNDLRRISQKIHMASAPSKLTQSCQPTLLAVSATQSPRKPASMQPVCSWLLRSDRLRHACGISIVTDESFAKSGIKIRIYPQHRASRLCVAYVGLMLYCLPRPRPRFYALLTDADSKKNKPCPLRQLRTPCRDRLDTAPYHCLLAF